MVVKMKNIHWDTLGETPMYGLESLPSEYEFESQCGKSKDREYNYSEVEEYRDWLELNNRPCWIMRFDLEVDGKEVCIDGEYF